MAKETGFQQRRSKLTPKRFLDALLYDVSADQKSLDQLSQQLHREHALSVSKQGLDARFSKESTRFVKSVLAAVMGSQGCLKDAPPALELFKRVRIKDSTTFELHDSLADRFRGFGNGVTGPNSRAAASIQYEFDIKGGSITHLNIKPGVQNDSRDALETKEDVAAGDLILRDVGYFSSEVLQHICQQKAFIISRLYHNINVYLSGNPNEKEPISFGSIYRQLLKEKRSTFDMEVFVGKRRLPVRLVGVLVPESVYQQRLKTRYRKNKHLGYNVSDEFRSRAHFNLFISNISKGSCSVEDICHLYRLRWQVELMFKVWKSVMGVNRVRKMKADRVETTLYARLLWIVVNWKLVADTQQALMVRSGKLLSVYKCFRTGRVHAQAVRVAISTARNLRAALADLIKCWSVKHWVEQKKGRIGLAEILPLMHCKVDVKCYI